MNKSAFITFEGGEGVGKSTQIRLLADHLRLAGRQVVLTREPGGSPTAEEVRNLLVTGDNDRWSPLAETLLFYAARVEHWRQVIAPALSAGQIVLCDRFSDSTLAYQAHAGGMQPEQITALHDLVLPGSSPDLTLILDMPVREGLARAKARPGMETRFEGKGLEFHEKLRNGFLQIAQLHPDRCIVVDASRDVRTIQVDILGALKARLNLG